MTSLPVHYFSKALRNRAASFPVEIHDCFMDFYPDIYLDGLSLKEYMDEVEEEEIIDSILDNTDLALLFAYCYNSRISRLSVEVLQSEGVMPDDIAQVNSNYSTMLNLSCLLGEENFSVNPCVVSFFFENREEILSAFSRYPFVDNGNVLGIDEDKMWNLYPSQQVDYRDIILARYQLYEFLSHAPDFIKNHVGDILIDCREVEEYGGEVDRILGRVTDEDKFNDY